MADGSMEPLGPTCCIEPETSGATLAPGCVARPSPAKLVCCAARALAAAWARAMASATLSVAIGLLAGAADSAALAAGGGSSHFRFLHSATSFPSTRFGWLRCLHRSAAAPSRGRRNRLFGARNIIRHVAHPRFMITSPRHPSDERRGLAALQPPNTSTCFHFFFQMGSIGRALLKS